MFLVKGNHSPSNLKLDEYNNEMKREKSFLMHLRDEEKRMGGISACVTNRAKSP